MKYVAANPLMQTLLACRQCVLSVCQDDAGRGSGGKFLIVQQLQLKNKPDRETHTLRIS